MKNYIHSLLAITLSLAMLLSSQPLDNLYAASVSGGMSQPEERIIDTGISDASANAKLPESKEESYIAEVSERRAEKSKTFFRGDGIFSAIAYDAAVHFRDNKGCWQEIDNRLLPSEDKSFYFSENGPVTKVFASDLSSGFLYSQFYKEHSVSVFIYDDIAEKRKHSSSAIKIMEPLDESAMSEFDAVSTPDYLSQTVLYPAAYDGVDLYYESYSNRIKENIVVNKPQDSYTYKFLMDAGNLTPKLDDTGSIRFYDASGIEIFQISAPYMTDAAGTVSSSAFYTLEEYTGEAEILRETEGEGDVQENEREDTDPTGDVTEEAAQDEEECREEQPSEDEQEELPSDVIEEWGQEADDAEAGAPESTPSGEQDAPEASAAGDRIPGEVAGSTMSGRDEAQDSGQPVTAASPLRGMLNTGNNGGTGRNYPRYLLTLTADGTWISASERTFPVTIDPTLDISSGTNSDDITSTYVMEGSPDTKQSNYQYLYAGYAISSKGLHSEIYLHVNSLPVLPDNCVAIAGCLGYYQPASNGWSAVGLSSLTLECHELTPASAPSDYKTWIRNLTWNTKPARSPAVLDYATVSSATKGSYASWDITEAVRKWYETPSDNKGLALVPMEDSFAASRAACAVLYSWGSTCPSRVIVNYRNTVGVEDTYTYREASADDAGMMCVSDYTHSMTLLRTDMNFDSVCDSFTLTHAYNTGNHGSQFTENEAAGIHAKNCDAMKMGQGWKLSAQQTIVPLTVSSELYLIWSDGDGTEHYFRRSATSPSIFNDEEGLGLTIHRTYPTSDTLLYTMTDTDSYHTWKFHNGYLNEISDSNGNRIFIAYNNNYSATGSGWKPALSSAANVIRQIVAQADGSSAVTLADFTYSGGYLSRITDYRGNATDFTYASGRLTDVKKADGNHVYYTYNARGYLISAKDGETGYSIGLSYRSHGNGGADTVLKYWEEAGSGAKGHTYELKKDSTQYGRVRWYGPDHATSYGKTGTGADDTLLCMSFDHSGRTINIAETDAEKRVTGVEAASYTRNSGTSKANNRVTGVAASGIEGVGLLLNSGMENTSSNVFGYAGAGSGGTGGTTTADTSGSAAISPHTGDRMIYNTITDTVSSGLTYRVVDLTAGKTYTLSGYVNTMLMDEAAEGMGNAGAFLAFTDTSRNVKAKSEPVSYKTSTQIEKGWEKIWVAFTPSVSGTYRAGLYMTGTTGTAYADDLQVEEGGIYSGTNLLQDGSFEHGGSAWWTYGAGTAVVTGSGECHDGIKGLRLTGRENGNVNAYQTVRLNCPSETTFLLSGWAKADSVPCASAPESTDNRRFALQALLTYSDSSTETQEVCFSSDFTDWQYASGAIVPKQAGKTVAGIRVSAVYNYNANAAYFDQITLKQEPVQTYSYDSDGKLINATAGGDAKASYTYYSGTHLIRDYTDLTGVNTSLTYEAATHNIQTVTSAGLVVTNAYNAAGTVTGSTTQSTGGGTRLQTSSSYGGNGHLLASATDGSGITTTYTYTGYRLASEKTGAADPVNYVYNNGNGRLTQSNTGSGGNAVSTGLGYTGGFVSRITRTASGLEQNYLFDRDSYGNARTISVNGGNSTGNIRLAAYSYESGVNNGRLTGMVYANGDTVGYTYDKQSRVAAENCSDGSTVHYSYSPEGDLAGQWVTDAAGTVIEKYSYVYDSLGRLIHSRQSDAGAGSNTALSMSQRTEHRYDTADRLIRQSWVLGTKDYHETYTYDSKGDLSIYAPAVGNALTYSYDGLNRLSSVTGGAYSKAYAYRDISASRSTLQVSSLSFSHGGTGTSLSYTYDDRGNILTEGNGSGSVTYTYDGRNQLTKVQDTINGITEQMSYDGAGNILTRTLSGNQSESHTYSYQEGRWRDLLTAFDGQRIAYEGQTYDSSTNAVTGSAISGNPSSYYNGRRWEFSWGKGTQLISAGSAASGSEAAVSISYGYDINGIRNRKTVNGTVYRYLTQNGQVVRQSWGSRVMDIIYDDTCAPYALNYSADGGSTFSAYYYVRNLQGDVIRLLDSSGNVAGTYQYDAWGRILSIKNGSGETASESDMAAINPIRYRGYYYDQESGLYYLNSRYYDPVVGRFISADGAEFASFSAEDVKETNLFAYVNNNPVMGVDPDGTLSNGWKIAVTGAILVASVAVIVATGGVASGPVMCAAISAANGAVTGAASGAASGAVVSAVTSAVKHRVTTGKWKGAGKAAVNGAAQGAIDGAFSGAITGAISGALHPTHCFVAGTAVLTAVGYVAIEKLKEGDLVWSWNEETGEADLKMVMQTFENESQELVHLHIDGEEIITTPTHPFYVYREGWRESIDLRAGDILVAVNGETVILEQIEHEILESPVKVYNFEVQDYHTYLINSRWGIVVHNLCVYQEEGLRTGQQHHPISKKIARKAANNSNLQGKVTRSIGTIQANTLSDHLGYQYWHRKVDKSIIRWMNKHPEATEAEFMRMMNRVYSLPGMVRRFGKVTFY